MNAIQNWRKMIMYVRPNTTQVSKAKKRLIQVYAICVATITVKAGFCNSLSQDKHDCKLRIAAEAPADSQTQHTALS